MGNSMFMSSVIVTGGKQRHDINMTHLTLSCSAVAACQGISHVFQGSLNARGLRLVARSLGGLTFCFPEREIKCT